MKSKANIPHLSKIVKAFREEDARLGNLPETEQTGHPFIICTNIARFLKEKFFSNAKVIGYSIDENPSALVGRDAGGHDFLLIENKFIIDLWPRYIECEGNVPLFMDIEKQPELAKKYYGDKKKWEEI